MSSFAKERLKLHIGPYSSALPHNLGMDLEIERAGGLLGSVDRVVSCELQTGYNYRGLEERIGSQWLDWQVGLKLVEELCAKCAQANLTAYVQAVEAISGLIVPPRATYLRMVLLEMERVTSHLLNAAELMSALNIPVETGLRDQRERLLQAMLEWSGARLQPGLIVFGGVGRNLDENACRALSVTARQVERALRNITTAVINSKEIAGRLVGLGAISVEEAALGGLRGPVARAAGLARDIRADFPTGAYEEEGTTLVVQRGGDAFSRLVVRLLEALESLRLVETALEDMPSGPIKARGTADMRAGSGVGRVEGPRGEVFCWARGERDRLTGLHISAGSAPTLGVLPGLARGIDPEDLRLLVLSLDICLTCAER